MKMYLRLSLTIGFCLLFVACKTVQLTSGKHEARTTATERGDTLMERDSLMVFVHEKNDTVRIVQREVKWKEKITVRHDTMTVIKTDTLRITEPRIRSPDSPLSLSKVWRNAIMTTLIIIFTIITTLMIKQLWDRLI